MRSASGKRTLGILAAVLVGGLLRHLFLEEMEFKYDEKYMYLAVRKAMDEGFWPWLGMKSGVQTRNPGMSLWIFNILGIAFQVKDPVELCRAVAWVATASLGMLGVFIVRKIPSHARTPWWWALALVSVNPFAVMYHRKIWTVCVLSFFLVPFLWAYWDRTKKAGAFFWGLIGACLGQIHMPGYFFAFAFFAASVWRTEDRKSIPWAYWIAGSTLGALPLLPWLQYIAHGSTGQEFSFSRLLFEISQLRFWSFWFSDPTGLTLGFILGLHRGKSWWEMNSDFMRYPLVADTPTYLVAVCILGSLVISLAVFGLAAWNVARSRFHRDRKDFDPTTHQAIWNGGAWYGVALTFSFAHIKRQYMPMTFPLEYLWFCREAVRAFGSRTLWVLGSLVVFQLVTTSAFLQYIVVNGGSPEGDYSDSYRKQQEQGTTWRDNIIVAE